MKFSIAFFTVAFAAATSLAQDVPFARDATPAQEASFPPDASLARDVTPNPASILMTRKDPKERCTFSELCFNDPSDLIERGPCNIDALLNSVYEQFTIGCDEASWNESSYSPGQAEHDVCKKFVRSLEDAEEALNLIPEGHYDKEDMYGSEEEEDGGYDDAFKDVVYDYKKACDGGKKSSKECKGFQHGLGRIGDLLIQAWPENPRAETFCKA